MQSIATIKEIYNACISAMVNRSTMNDHHNMACSMHAVLLVSQDDDNNSGLVNLTYM